jgi:hypothetical protein
MNEREIKDIVRNVLANGDTLDAQIAEIADRWHEAVARAHKETYMTAHGEGYNDGLRDGRAECQEAENLEAA